MRHVLIANFTQIKSEIGFLMGKNPPSHLQEIIFASSNKAQSRRITALVKKKLIRKIAPRIYTSNLSDEHWKHISEERHEKKVAEP